MRFTWVIARPSPNGLIIAAFNGDKKNPERPNLYPQRGCDVFYYRNEFSRSEAERQLRKMFAAAKTPEEIADVSRFSVWPVQQRRAVALAQCDPYPQAVKRGTY